MVKPNHHPANVRIKRRYLIWKKEARGYSVASIDMAAAAIERFESHTGYRDFKRLHVEQILAFKRHLSEDAVTVKSGQPLSRATITSTLRALQAFFMWLADQQGYRTHVRYSLVAYFAPSGQDTRIAGAERSRPSPGLEEALKALEAMPVATETERRDRAVFAFVLLTAARDHAVATFKLKHLDLASNKVVQDAREVKTKRSKTFTSAFLPVGPEPRRIVEEWATYLQVQKGFGPGDPLFPATLVGFDGDARFTGDNIDRRHWKTTTPIRNIFRDAFTRVGLPYFNPHSLRSTLVRLGLQLCRSQEEFTSWSQNMGHSNTAVTFGSYGKVSEHRQCEIIAALANRKPDEDNLETEIEELLRKRKAGRN